MRLIGGSLLDGVGLPCGVQRSCNSLEEYVKVITRSHLQGDATHFHSVRKDYSISHFSSSAIIPQIHPMLHLTLKLEKRHDWHTGKWTEIAVFGKTVSHRRHWSPMCFLAWAHHGCVIVRGQMSNLFMVPWAFRERHITVAWQAALTKRFAFSFS